MNVCGFDGAKRLRIGIGALIATMAIFAAPGDAVANHRRHFAHHHRAHARILAVEPAARTAATLGPMRYYGGPKSPMWRAPAGS